jgi:hypothetical protein
MKRAAKQVQTKIYLPADVKRLLDDKYKQTGLSRSMIVELLIRNFLHDDIVRGLRPQLQVEELIRVRKPRRGRVKRIQIKRETARADYGKRFKVDFTD